MVRCAGKKDDTSGKGLVHIYCGDGKGKTTTSVGLTIRAAGSGKKVLFYQFLKDNSSSERNILEKSSWDHFSKRKRNAEVYIPDE